MSAAKERVPEVSEKAKQDSSSFASSAAVSQNLIYTCFHYGRLRPLIFFVFECQFEWAVLSFM